MNNVFSVEALELRTIRIRQIKAPLGVRPEGRRCLDLRARSDIQKCRSHSVSHACPHAGKCRNMEPRQQRKDLEMPRIVGAVRRVEELLSASRCDHSTLRLRRQHRRHNEEHSHPRLQTRHPRQFKLFRIQQSPPKECQSLHFPLAPREARPLHTPALTVLPDRGGDGCTFTCLSLQVSISVRPFTFLRPYYSKARALKEDMTF